MLVVRKNCTHLGFETISKRLRKLRCPYTIELSGLLTSNVRKWRLGCERLSFESKSPARVKEGILNDSLLFLVFAAVFEDSRTDEKASLFVHSRKARQISKCHGLGKWIAGRRFSPPDSSGSGRECSGQLLEQLENAIFLQVASLNR